MGWSFVGAATVSEGEAPDLRRSNKGLGQLERTNVKWPKAPLNAPAMRRDDDADASNLGVEADSKHESGQQTGCILP
jgi:hypothetical protein